MLACPACSLEQYPVAYREFVRGTFEGKEPFTWFSENRAYGAGYYIGVTKIDGEDLSNDVEFLCLPTPHNKPCYYVSYAKDESGKHIVCKCRRGIARRVEYVPEDSIELIEMEYIYESE